MYNVHITLRIPKPPYISVRKFREIMKRNHARLARGWHQHMLPQHFTQPAAGGGKYGYAMRDPKYVAAKRELAQRQRRGKPRVVDGGRFALVKSGDTRRQAMLAPEVKAYPTRARLTLFVPIYASMRPRPGAAPNLGKELVKVTAAESRILQKQMAKRVWREFHAARSEKRKTVKV